MRKYYGVNTVVVVLLPKLVDSSYGMVSSSNPWKSTMEKLISTSGGGVPNPIIEAAAIGFIEARPKPSVAVDAANQANIPRLIIIFSAYGKLNFR